MYQKDYILRHVTLAAQVIARIVGLKKSGQYQQALQQIEGALQEFLGLSAALAAQLSVSELLMICRSGNLLDKDKALLLATLLKEEADISEAVSQPTETRDAYIKALTIALEALADADTTLGREYLPLVEELTTKLREGALDSEVRYELSKYYEMIGDASRARNYRRGW